MRKQPAESAIHLAMSSGEGEASWSFPEWQVTTFSVDCTNQRAVLAVQKWLAVIDLRDTTKVKTDRKLGRSNKYEVKTVLWNPHHEKRDLLVSTSLQKLEIWNVVAERNTQLQSFKAHSRPVSDVSWSFTDSNLLASCGGESFINVWDLRETRRAKTSFKAVAGASLVQWNRLSGNIIASAHDSDIRLWDMRKPTIAWGYVTAHMTRIHDIDWNHLDEHQLTTCSHDSSVKFWDTRSPREPLSTIKTGSQPIWRAKNYPVGRGVAMLLVPALHGSENRVFLWSRSNVSSPVSILQGHKGAVVEAQWRKVADEYQLVTLSRDRTLRLWPISEQLSSDLGAVVIETEGPREEVASVETSLSSRSQMETETTFIRPQDSVPLSLSPAKTSASPRTSSLTTSFPPSLSSVTDDKTASPSSFQPGKAAQKLEHEFSLLNTNSIPSVTIEMMDATQRSCTVCVAQGEHLVRIMVTFPSHYPNGAAPFFTFDKSTSIDFSSQQDLHRSLTDIAQSHTKSNRPCLEPCLRRLSKVMESVGSHPPQPPPSLQPPLRKSEFDLLIGGQLDDRDVPFPRLTGARFCSNGILVSFTGQANFENRETPRSLDQVAPYRSHLWSVNKARRSAPFLSSSLPKGSSGNLMQLALTNQPSFASHVVTVSDVSHLLPLSYDLARMYSLSGADISELCSRNASVAALLDRPDLVRAWSVTALVANSELPVPADPSFGDPWSQHPFSRQLIYSLFKHYSALHDVQTLAMLSCIFQLHCQQYEQTHPTPSFLPSFTSPRSSPLPLQAGLGTRLSSSWQDIETGFIQTSSAATNSSRVSPEDDEKAQEERTHSLNCLLLDVPLIRQGDEYRRCYTDILYRWQLLEQRAEVVKLQSERSEDQSEIGFMNYCRECGRQVKGPTCKESQCFAFNCNICNLSVRGSSNFCVSCGHGGHASHMEQWFASHSECPAGCGCSCLEASGWT